jgi:flagellar basal-body rod protein FlgC
MTAFSAMDIGRTGMGFSSYWLDVIGHNLANVNNVTPGDEEAFRERFVVAGTNTDQIAPTGSGVHVADIVVDEEKTAPKVFDPSHPMADEDGYITRAVVDVAAQMANMILAQRAYQLNAKSVTNAKEAYEAALRIGQR